MRYAQALVLFSVGLIAGGCGSNDAASSAANAPSTVTGTSSEQAASISNQSAAAKMARQTHDDVQEQADLSETATYGSSDGGGTKAPAQQSAAGFGMQVSPGVDFNSITVDFQGSMTFSGAHDGAALLHGQCEANVHRAGNDNLLLVLDTNMTRTQPNGDVISVVTEPNVVLTKAGTRQQGSVTRTVQGSVHRSLTSASDANRDFNVTITHDGTTVVDTYGHAGWALEKRVINGNSTLVDHRTGMTSTVAHIDIERGQPSTCLCPTGGTIKQTVSKDGQSETHTYTFGGTCGASTVAVDGSAAVATAVSAAASSTGEAISSSATVHVTGSLTWEQCVPSSN